MLARAWSRANRIEYTFAKGHYEVLLHIVR